MPLKQRIENALYQRNGFRYQHSDWDKKIWNKSKDEIKKYFLERFLNTMDEVEYRACQVLLYHQIPNKQLFVEFKESPQYKRYWKQTDKITMKETPKISTETPISPKIRQVKTVNEVTIIGE